VEKLLRENKRQEVYEFIQTEQESLKFLQAYTGRTAARKKPPVVYSLRYGKVIITEYKGDLFDSLGRMSVKNL
jgi:hypothetical protein